MERSKSSTIMRATAKVEVWNFTPKSDTAPVCKYARKTCSMLLLEGVKSLRRVSVCTLQGEASEIAVLRRMPPASAGQAGWCPQWVGACQRESQWRQLHAKATLQCPSALLRCGMATREQGRQTAWAKHGCAYPCACVVTEACRVPKQRRQEVCCEGSGAEGLSKGFGSY